MRKVDKNLLTSGLVLVALGAFFGYAGRNLAITLAGNMGPGYFPQVLSVVLVLLGLVTAVNGLRSTAPAASEAVDGPIPWRAIVLLTAALLWFALAVRPLGLGPALAIALLLSCMASERSRLVPSLVLAATMVLFAWAVFIRGLRMPVALLGPWFH